MARSPADWKLLYEDNHLLVVDKPAGLATMGAAPGEASLFDLVCADLKIRYKKPGNVYLGVVSRIDKPVSGLVVFARTSKAAGRLSALFRDRNVEKIYWGIVAGQPRPAHSERIDWLAQGPADPRVRVVRPTDPGASEAVLRYHTRLARASESLLEITLLTGRKHQIRVQLAQAGHPLHGDVKYGSRRAFASGIALHARRLCFEHPVQRKPLVFEAPLPPAWRGWERALADQAALHS